MSLLFLVCIFLFLSLCSASLPRISSSSSLSALVDEYGRYRIFRGINFVTKSPPYYPELLLNESVASFYSSSLGMNAIRLGCLWGGVEPVQGQQDSSYIEHTRTIIRNLAENNIYSLLDAHQDVGGPPASYPGIPGWAMDLSVPQHAFPWPFNSTEFSYWGLAYVTQKVSVAFGDLYANKHGLRDHFIRFWNRVVQEFKDEDGILGYEIINEPWPGDVYTNPLLFIPGIAGSVNLLPFYDAVSSAIRSIDSSHLIFFEPVTWGMVLNGSIVGSGFNRVPGGDEYRNMSVFSYHYYCILLNTDQTQPYPTLLRTLCDDVLGPLVFKSSSISVRNDMKGTGMFLTEWGTCGSDGHDGDINTEECEAVLQMADQHLQSWTFWESGSVTPSGGGINPLISLQLARPFSRATCGVPLSMSFRRSDRVFTFVYELDLSIEDVEADVVTEIVVPPYQYGNVTQYQVQITPQTMDWKVSDTEVQIVQVFLKQQLTEQERKNADGQTVSVIIKPIASFFSFFNMDFLTVSELKKKHTHD